MNDPIWHPFITRLNLSLERTAFGARSPSRQIAMIQRLWIVWACACTAWIVLLPVVFGLWLAQELVAKELQRCTQNQKEAYARFRIPFYQVPIHRLGSLERVWVVAKLPLVLLYYEDVEEGFELGVLDEDGALQDHGCNHYELSHVLAQAGL